jgi:hypothetical protein
MTRLFSLWLTAILAVPAFAADDGKWTTVKGRIVWDAVRGPAPVRAAIKPTRDEEVCAKDKDFKTEDWVISPKGGIKNVVVWLVPEPDAAWAAAIKAGKKKDLPAFDQKDIHPNLAKAPAAAASIDQPCCRFIPHIVTARAGQKMVIKNSAPVQHNAKWTSRNNDEFNPLIPAGQQFDVPTPLVMERSAIKIECSIHPWMSAYVWVFDHPYFAVTDEDGNFQIKDAPVLNGKLRLVAWEESGGLTDDWRLGQSIDVKAGTIDLKDMKLKMKPK